MNSVENLYTKSAETNIWNYLFFISYDDCILFFIKIKKGELKFKL